MGLQCFFSFCAVRIVLCFGSGLCLSQQPVNALFPRIQEKKSIVAANFLIWGFKAHHMLGLGSRATLPQQANSCNNN